MTVAADAITLHDLRTPAADMRSDVLEGLRARPRRIAPKYFYDARGSQLFERICAQPQYYLTRAEIALLETHGAAIAAALGPHVCLIEYGSGSGIKTRLLLGHLDAPVAYMPVEISPQALLASVRTLAAQFPGVDMLPVCADFTQPLELPQPRRAARRRVVYFPGSTIGNFDKDDAVALLTHMRTEMGDNGAALVGVDLVKDPALIEAAYNDDAGITAEFTLNMLARFNRELDADFQLGAFAHRAIYNRTAERVETAIVSRFAQDVHVAGERFHFDAGEAIHVELSGKYSQASFARLAARAGLRIEHGWRDPAQLFSVFCLVPAAA